MSKILRRETPHTIHLSALGIIIFLSSCCSFDREVAINEFVEHKHGAKIIDFDDYECSGTMCDCRYAQIKYILTDTSVVYDTTLQYWKTDSGWIPKKEFDKNLK